MDDGTKREQSRYGWCVRIVCVMSAMRVCLGMHDGMLCRYLCMLYDALRICAMRDGQAGRSASMLKTVSNLVAMVAMANAAGEACKRVEIAQKRAENRGM